MKIKFKRILRNIPIVRRIYTSFFVRLLKLINKEIFLVEFMKTKFELNINEPIDKSILLFDYYEDKQINYTAELMRKYNVNIFFDIGANCGLYSLIIANKFNKINIYSFEPVETSYKKLIKNISINKNTENIKIYNYGLSNKNSELKMKALIKNHYIQLGGFGVVNKNDSLKNKYLIDANFKKGDDNFKFKNKIIFLKIDVEGHEIYVLEGLTNLLKSNKIIIQIEILPGGNKLVEEQLIKLGFIKIKKINFDYYFVNRT